MHNPHLLARARYNPAHDEAWQAFQDAAGVEPEADDEQIDDDIAIEHAGSSLAPNERCPISGRPVCGWCWFQGHAGQAAGAGLVTSAAEWRGSHCAWCRTVRRAWPARRSTCSQAGQPKFEAAVPPACPNTTSMQLLDLREPVVDSRGYVYEQAAILDWLRQHGNSAKCPGAGRPRVCGQRWAALRVPQDACPGAAGPSAPVPACLEVST